MCVSCVWSVLCVCAVECVSVSSALFKYIECVSHWHYICLELRLSHLTKGGTYVVSSGSRADSLHDPLCLADLSRHTGSSVC